MTNSSPLEAYKAAVIAQGEIRNRIISALKTYELPEELARLLALDDEAGEALHAAFVTYEHAKVTASLKSQTRNTKE